MSNRKQWVLSALLVLAVAAFCTLLDVACGALGVPHGRICETVTVAPDAGLEVCGNPADIAVQQMRTPDAGGP